LSLGRGATRFPSRTFDGLPHSYALAAGFGFADEAAHEKSPLRECSPMTRRQQPHIDRRFDIDEPTSDTLPKQQSSAQQYPLEYGKLVDAHRLAAVSENGGWWNPTTQELIPLLREDHPDYRQNEAMITEAIRRWNGITSR
jgi:hypothetical protein